MATSAQIRKSRADVSIGGNNSALMRVLRQSRDEIDRFGRQVRNIGLAVAGAGIASGAALFGSAVAFSNVGDELAKMAKRTGMSVENLSRLRYAAELSATSMSEIEVAIKVLSRALDEASQGTDSYIDALAELGLTYADLVGLTQDQRFAIIADRISRIEDPARKAATALQFFGRSGTRLLPLLEMGARGLRDMTEEADRFGLTIDTKTAAKAEELNDALGRMKLAAENVALRVGAALSEPLTRLANAIAWAVANVGKFIQANPELVQGFALAAGGAVALGSSLVALGLAYQGIGLAISLATTAISSPFTLAVAGASVAMVGLGMAFNAAGGDIVAVLGNVWSMVQYVFGDLKQTIGGVVAALSNGNLGAAMNIAMLGLKMAWLKGWQALGIDDLTASIRAAFIIAFAGIEGAAIDLFQFFAELGARIVALWQGVTGWLEDLFTKAVAYATTSSVEEYDALVEQMRQDRAGTQSDQNAQNAARMEEIGKLASNMRNASIESRDAALVESERKYQDELKATEDAIRSAKAELDRATKEQTDAAKAASDVPQSRQPLPLPDLAINRLRDALTGRGAAGTFGGAAAQSLNGRGGPLEKIEQYTKETATATKDIARKARDGGIVWE